MTQEGAGWGASQWFITAPAFLILAVSGPANKLREADSALAKLGIWFYTHLHAQPQERNNNNKGSLGWRHHSELLWSEQSLRSHKYLSPHCQPWQCRHKYLNFCRLLPLKPLPALELPFDTHGYSLTALHHTPKCYLQPLETLPAQAQLTNRSIMSPSHHPEDEGEIPF